MLEWHTDGRASNCLAADEREKRKKEKKIGKGENGCYVHITSCKMEKKGKGKGRVPFRPK